ncbi:Rrf2 family protein [Paenibacillus favisporus]|uniref:Rrf2 family protein n=1 Tax=Paenibacillus favisporus TaxID=221028 RepID=A0ABV2F9R7_9BACL
MGNRSQQFSVAVHILCFLEFNKKGRTTSELLAMSVNANPAVIRRIMRKLTKGGLITSTLGTNAAISLAQKADQITLLDVYRATMEDNQEIFMIHRDTNPTCPVGSKMPYLLDGVYSKVQSTMENELSGITIDSMVKSGIVEIKG